MEDLRRSYFREAGKSYRRPIVDRRYADPIDMFDSHTYSKGALVLHILHYLLGEEGWWKGIRSYVERFAGQTVTTSDFQDAMETATGVSLGPLFEQYVYGAGHPELKVKWDYRAETRQVHLEIRQTQKLDGQTGLFSFPLEVALVGERETVTRRVPVAARDFQDLYIPSDERPRTVVLDPEGWILDTVDFIKPAAEWTVQLTASKPLAARIEAIRALGELGGDEAVAALGRALREEPFHGAREEAAKALGKIAKAPSLEPLRGGLADKDSRVRTAVLEALGAFPDHRELIPILRRALETDDSYAARAAAAGALGEFKKARRGRSRADRGPLPGELPRAGPRRGDPGPGQGRSRPRRGSRRPAGEVRRPHRQPLLALEALVTLQKEDSHRRDEVRKILRGLSRPPLLLPARERLPPARRAGGPRRHPCDRAPGAAGGRRPAAAQRREGDREDPRQRSGGA